tara:strand:+ start:102 stop:527 length:426 start_codon:yes stop_codon:yes gene_type:complete
MIIKIAFKLIDSDSSQKLMKFDELNEKIKNIWTNKQFTVNTNIDEVVIEKNQVVNIYDYIENNEKYNLILKSITLIKCFKDNKIYSQYAVSDDLLGKTDYIYKKNKNIKYYYFYLKNNLKFNEIDDFFYILEKDIKSIIKK